MPLLDQSSGDLTNLFRMGETVKCPTNIGPVNFVLVKLADNSEVHMCNFGIFSCSCSNILMTNDSSGETASIELVIDSSLATGDAVSFSGAPFSTYGTCTTCEVATRCSAISAEL